MGLENICLRNAQKLRNPKKDSASSVVQRIITTKIVQRNSTSWLVAFIVGKRGILLGSVLITRKEYT